MRTTTAVFLAGSLCIAACALEGDELDDTEVADEDLQSDAYALAGPALPTVAAGNYHSCAVSGDGSVQCWGAGSFGRLGNGGTSNSAVPLDVAGIDDAIAVTTGAVHSCALRAGGTVWCWGNNASGQLGIGSTTHAYTPMQVSGLSGVVAVSAGGYHTCAVKTSGQVACWGYNVFGQLGNGTTAMATTPRTVGAKAPFWPSKIFVPESAVVDVEAGSFSTCARKSSGQVRCWGRNIAGEVGDGTTVQRNSPVTVGSIANASDITVGDRHACAVVGDGTLWCWGANNYGQLGDNSTTTRTSPVQTIWLEFLGIRLPLTGVQTASAGGAHTCVTTASDVQWCAGRNNYDQHGRGNTADRHTIAETAVRAVQTSAGAAHTCVRTLTGAVQCFGLDNYGQLGGFDGCPDGTALALADVSAPAGDTYTNGGIYYLTGDGADVTLIASECADIDRVVLNGLALGTAPGPDGGTRYYQILSQTSLGDGTVRIIVRVHYKNTGHGTSFPLQIAVLGGDGEEAVVDTTVVGVLTVGGNGALIHLAQNEIRNEVFAAMYDKFGDANYYDRSSYPDLYDFDYDDLQVYLTGSGIFFSGAAKARVLGDIDICDPKVSVNGTFRIVEDGIGISTAWVDGPNIDTDFPLLCDVLTLELSQFVASIIDFTTDDNLQRRIDRRIRKLGEVCEEPLGCSLVVQAINHLGGAVEIEIKPLIPTVAILNTYDTDELEDFDGFGDPMVRGTAIPDGQAVAFSTSETVLTCSIPTATCTSEARAVSGTGVFNRDVNPPVPTPWPTCPHEPCPYYSGRQGPWQNMLGARRDAALLPLPNHSVAALVGRTFSRADGDLVQGAPFFAGDHLCVMPGVDGDAVKLVLGRNDINATTGGWLGEYGTGDAVVTIGFPSPGLADLLDACEE